MTTIEAIRVGGKEIGRGHPCFVTAEVAQAHDGSLGAAHAYIDAAARAGVDAVKFQTHIASEESTAREPWRVKFSRQDATRYDYWKRMEFTPDQWAGLAEHARERGLVFLSSPFSVRAVEWLERLAMPAWKIASGEVTNLPLLRAVARTGKPVLLSSGLSTWDELDAAIATVRGLGGDVAVYQATTSYPCPPERLGLNALAELRDRYGCPVGLSDHSATIYAGLAAAALGADLLEAHIVMSRDSFGPDTSSSLTVDEMAQLVEGVRFIGRALAHPVDKGRAGDDVAELKRTFGKSIVAARALTAGTTLREADLALKKPGNGLPATRLDDVIGKTLRADIAEDGLIRDEDLV